MSGPVGPGSNPSQGGPGGPASRQIGTRAPMSMPRTNPSGPTGPAAPSTPSAPRPLAGAPAAAAPKKSRKGLWIALIIVGAIIALLIIAELIASNIKRQNGAEGLDAPAPAVLALEEAEGSPLGADPLAASLTSEPAADPAAIPASPLGPNAAAVPLAPGAAGA
ncbi:hypothetical protein USB125703_01279 [Pseudoclavibacter triregionum]|nr:hypothetical protein USB125703_01279 [Pseudoclavibacter triregionum]